MDIIITEWALNAYLDLKHDQAFSLQEYRAIIRPDVLRLRQYPQDPKFGNNKFWSPATGLGNSPLQDGYKMKWHQIGAGKTQLRLCVAFHAQAAFLCEAYVKTNEKREMRQLLRFETHMQLIRAGRYTERGRLV